MWTHYNREEGKHIGVCIYQRKQREEEIYMQTNHGTNLYHTNETQHLKPKPLTQLTMCNASHVSTRKKEKANKD